MTTHMPSNNPLAITLTANDGSNHIYISTDTSLNVMTLTLTNTTTSDIVFQQYSGGAYGINQLPASNTGIYLLFNGLLSNMTIQGVSITAPGWTPQTTSDDQNGAYWVLLPASNVSLAPGDSLRFTLGFPAITGSANSGYFSCQCVNVQAASLVNAGEQLYVTLVYPPRTDGAAPAILPVQFEFIGDNVVYNGGVSNTLSFRITNTSDAALIPGGSAAWGSATPQFKLYFIQDENAAAGSLLTAAEAGGTNINIEQAYGNKLGINIDASSSPVNWVIEENESLNGTDGTMLGTGVSASMSFTITSLKTNVAESITMAVLEYKGFPGYEDGQLTAEIRVKNGPPQPSITAFYASSTKINITQTSNPVYIYFMFANTQHAELYQEGTSVKSISNPVINTVYSATVMIDHTSDFTLVATGTDGQSTRSLTVQVDTVPIGTITMWSGYLSAIPAGWTICDGTNGTPDLRERFVLGASGDSSNNLIPNPPNVTPLHYLKGTGGGGTHTHTIMTNTKAFTTNKDGQHNHSMTFNKTHDVDAGSNNSNSYYHGDGTENTDNDSVNSLHTHSFTIPSLSGTAQAAHAELPAYCALYFIMKYA